MPVIEVIPHVNTDPKAGQVNLETAMQALVLDTRHPLALEITGERTAKRFLLRATTPEAILHAQEQLRMRYPQVTFEPVADDLLFCHPGEVASVIELREGAESYLPLRTWEDRALQQPGTDPLLGVLGALSVPDDLRAVAQIALVPAPPAWSRKHQRRALEQALDAEKTQQQMHLFEAKQRGPSTLGVILVSVLLLGVLLAKQFHLSLPVWVLKALSALLHGHLPSLTALQWQQIGGTVGVLVLVLALSMLLRQRMTQARLYDQKLAAQKTLSMAYRVRLRLYVIGPAGPLQRPFWDCLFAAIPRQRFWHECRTLWQEHQGRRVQQRRRAPILLALVAAYRQYHLARGDYFVAHRLSRRRVRALFGQDGVTQLLHVIAGHLQPGRFPGSLVLPWLTSWIERRNWARGIRRSSHLLAPESLAALWHLLEGAALQETTFVHFRRTRLLLLPEALMVPEREHKRAIGVSVHAGQSRAFVLPPGFTRNHTLLGGQSGEGKSTFMLHLAVQAIHAGEACCVLDPHGDLVDQLLMSIPPTRVQETVLIDFGDPDCAIGLNPLDVTLGRNRDKAIDDLLVTFKFIWKDSWGNRMEAPLRHALLTLFEANTTLVAHDPAQGPDHQYTLLDVLPLLTDESFCHALLSDIEDAYLKRWWYVYYEPLTLQQQRERTDPVFTKMAKLEMKAARRIVGQGRSTLNVAQLIRERKILLVNLAKGKAGSDTAPLLGSTLMGLLLAALQEQSSRAPEDRVRLPICIDEFQALGGVDYHTMLAELRKWGGMCCLATQSFAYLQELNPELLPTVLANVKQKVIYRMSAKDARIIAPEIGVKEEDIVNLEPHQCYVSLPFADRQQPTFSLRLHLPTPGDPQIADAVRHQSRMRYTHSVQEIDIALHAALTRTIRAKPLETQTNTADPPKTSTGEEKKRVRTRKGKTEGTDEAGNGQVHAMELLAVPSTTAPMEEEQEPEAGEEHAETC